MTPAEYATIVVLPTVRAFMEKPDDQRLLYLACISTYHMVDHIAKATRTGNGQVVRALSAGDQINKEVVDIVQGICHGTKHAEVTHDNTPFKFRAGEDKPYEGMTWDGTDTNGWDAGHWDGPARQVSYNKASFLVHHCVARFLWRVEHEYPAQFAGVDWKVGGAPTIETPPP